MSQTSSTGRRSASQARGREGGAMRWASADGEGWQVEPVGDGGGSVSPALIPTLTGRLGAVPERAEPRLHLGVPAAPESHRQPEGAAAALPRPGVLTGPERGPEQGCGSLSAGGGGSPRALLLVAPGTGLCWSWPSAASARLCRWPRAPDPAARGSREPMGSAGRRGPWTPE